MNIPVLTATFLLALHISVQFPYNVRAVERRLDQAKKQSALTGVPQICIYNPAWDNFKMAATLLTLFALVIYVIGDAINNLL